MSVMDFRDDLANLHGSGNPQDPSDHSYRHNIFDVSAPAASSPHSSLGFNDFHEHNVHQQNMQQHHHAYLNSTLPALNSSMRYDPLPPPDSFGFSSGSGLPRHTPSPIDGHNARESRSRSRPPTGAPSGVVRTTRTRRTGSMSSTSPPPPNGTSQWGIDFAMQRPGAQAIVIPRSHSQSGHHGGGTPVSPVSAGWDYSLPTPDNMGGHSLPSLHHHHHPHHGSYGNGYPSAPNYGLGISPGADNLSLGGPASLTSSTLSGSPTSNGPPTPPSATGPPPKGEKTTLLASEKRRRRRESHNAVERRRRDNINEKIGELATLIPISMLAAEGEKVPNGGTNGLITIPITSTNSQDIEAIAGLMPPEGETSLSELWNTTGKESSPTSEARDGSVPPSLQEGGVVKANKGMILRKSVEYIRYLQQIVTAQGARNRELEDQVRAYREGPHSGHGTKTPTPGSLGAFSSYGVSGSITGIGMGMFGASLEDLPEHLEEGEDGAEEEEYRGRSTTKGSRGATGNGKRIVHNVDMDGDDEEMELIENATTSSVRGEGVKEVKMEL